MMKKVEKKAQKRIEAVYDLDRQYGNTNQIDKRIGNEIDEGKK